MTDDGQTVDGFSWIDVDMPGLADHRVVASTRGNPGPVRILFPTGKGPSATLVSKWQAKPDNVYSITPSISFKPFDERAMFPGMRVSYYQADFLHFDLQEWVGAHRKMDARIQFLYDGSKAEAVVETMRKGSLVRVRRKLDPELPFDRAMQPILRYFERNCPPPAPGAASAVTCGPHVNALLSHLTAIGVEHVDRWCSRIEERVGPERIEELGINTAMLRGLPDVQEVTLRVGRDTHAVHARVRLEKGHLIRDDDAGTTIDLRASLPETLLAGTKGRDVTEIIDIGWLRGLTVRTARGSDGTTLRAAANNEPLTLPRDVVDDDQAIAHHLRDVSSETGSFSLFHEDVRQVLEAMTPSTLLAVLLILQRDGRVDLDDHGFPEWSLQAFGTTVVMSRCPMGSMADVVSKVLKSD
jgi:hypothetical protein